MIAYEDPDVLVVDKPPGLVCHSASRPEHRSLADWLRARGLTVPRLINRLDRETSGLVLVAKNARAGKILGKQVLRREIEKEYLAIVWGQLAADRGTIDAPIAVRQTGPVWTKRIIAPTGKPSRTDYQTERRWVSPKTCHSCYKNLPAGFSLVRLWPRTGRAHQLRVHLAWLGHPIVGDKVYGPDERWYLEFIQHGVTPALLAAVLLPRHALHACRLMFRQPTTHQPVTCAAELPGDLRAFLEEPR